MERDHGSRHRRHLQQAHSDRDRLAVAGLVPDQLGLALGRRDLLLSLPVLERVDRGQRQVLLPDVRHPVQGRRVRGVLRFALVHGR